MRRFLGVFVVLLIAGAVLAVSSCSGSGGRRTIPPLPGFAAGAFYPLVEGADSGLWSLVLTNGFALFNSDSSYAAFDDASGGGFAFVDEETFFYGMDSYDLDGDGFMDQVAMSMRWLPATAVETGYIAGYALVGGADYLPHELGAGNLVLYLPLNQAYRNSSFVLAWWNGSSWEPIPSDTYSTASIVLHPDAAFSGIYVVEVRDFNDFLGPIGVFAPFHTAGVGG